MCNLNAIMRANALSCILFGLIFASQPLVVSSFLSDSQPAPEWLVLLLGAVLIFNGLHLLWVAKKSSPAALWVLYFSVGDFLWVLGVALIILSGIWITTPVGLLAAIVVSIMVGTFGVMQFIKRHD